MNNKKYMSIERIRECYTEGFTVGDHIIISEKIDGSNASYQYDEESDSIKSFSRKCSLGLSNNLRGFWEWTQTLDRLDKRKELDSSYRYSKYPNYRIFGEWLVKHSITYP